MVKGVDKKMTRDPDAGKEGEEVSVEMNRRLGLIASFLTGAAAFRNKIFRREEGKNFSFPGGPPPGSPG